MIWPFRPRCPLALRTKVELEVLFEKAARSFGNEALQQKQILTDADLKPLLLQTDQNDWGQTVGNFIAQRFPQPLTGLKVIDSQPENFSGEIKGQRYEIEAGENKQQYTIRLDENLKSVPEQFLATTAIAVAECYQQLQTDAAPVDDPQTPEFADLAPLFYGFAPLVANSSLHESAASEAGPVSYQMKRFVRFSAEQHGYLMALADWSLNTQHANRANELRLDARETLQKSLKYLQKTTDCSLQPGFLSEPADHSVDGLKAKLQSGSDSQILAALYGVADGTVSATELMTPLRQLVRHSEADIQEIAVRALGTLQQLPAEVHEELFLSIEHGSPALRRAAISGLRPGYHHDDTVKQEILQRLGTSDPRTAVACLNTLFRYESIGADGERSLAKAMTRMLHTGDGNLPLAVQYLEDRCENPDGFINRVFGDDPSAMAIVAEIRNQSDAEDAPTDSSSA